MGFYSAIHRLVKSVLIKGFYLRQDIDYQRIWLIAVIICQKIHAWKSAVGFLQQVNVIPCAVFLALDIFVIVAAVDHIAVCRAVLYYVEISYRRICAFKHCVCKLYKVC